MRVMHGFRSPLNPTKNVIHTFSFPRKTHKKSPTWQKNVEYTHTHTHTYPWPTNLSVSAPDVIWLLLPMRFFLTKVCQKYRTDNQTKCSSVYGCLQPPLHSSVCLSDIMLFDAPYAVKLCFIHKFSFHEQTWLSLCWPGQQTPLEATDMVSS